jgi:hypothetical protein
MRKSLQSAGCLLLSALLLAGCAATVQRADAPGSEARVVAPPSTRHLIIVLEPAAGIARDENWDALREEWVTSLSAIAPARGLRGTVADRAPARLEDDALLVVARVEEFRYRSQAARYGFGVMTGNAYMTLELEYRAPPDARVIGSRRVSTRSSAWEGVFSAMTPKQVEAVVTDIVDGVVQR